MADSSTCYSLACGEIVAGTVTTCPKCGSKMRTSRQVRLLGWLLIAAGVFLTGFMGFITLELLPSLVPLGHSAEAGGFTGTDEQGKMILGVLGLVIAFGLASLFNGLWQVVTGRRNRFVAIITLLLAAVLVLTVYSTTQNLGG